MTTVVSRDSLGRVIGESAFVDGKLDGETVLYSNGKVTARIPYSSGKQNGLAMYFGKTGEVLMKSHYQDGRLEGESLYFDPSGKLVRKSMYHAGMLHGRTVEYYPDGSPREISEYVDDLLEGGVFRFNEKGQMIERLCFEKGRQRPCPDAKEKEELLMAWQACTQALLKCSCGTAKSRLLVPPVYRVTVGRQPAATVLDSKPLVNILPFGQCSSLKNPLVLAALRPQPCVPLTSGPWILGGPATASIEGVPMLSDGARLVCAWAGVIQFESPGQFTCQAP